MHFTEASFWWRVTSVRQLFCTKRYHYFIVCCLSMYVLSRWAWVHASILFVRVQLMVVIIMIIKVVFICYLPSKDEAHYFAKFLTDEKVIFSYNFNLWKGFQKRGLSDRIRSPLTSHPCFIFSSFFVALTSFTGKYPQNGTLMERGGKSNELTIILKFLSWITVTSCWHRIQVYGCFTF